MPHTMKNVIIRLAAVLVVVSAVVSCNTKSTFTPGLRVLSVLQRTTAEGVQDSISLADSLNIGDTVRMTMIVDGYFDYLLSVVAKADTGKVKVSLEWNDEQMDMLSPEADLQHGKLIFLPSKVPACVTVLTYIPVESGTHPINIDVTSFAEAPYSSSSWSFNVAVRSKEQQ